MLSTRIKANRFCGKIFDDNGNNQTLMVRVQTVQSFFHCKSKNENQKTIRYPIFHFSIQKQK